MHGGEVLEAKYFGWGTYSLQHITCTPKYTISIDRFDSFLDLHLYTPDSAYLNKNDDV